MYSSCIVCVYQSVYFYICDSSVLATEGHTAQRSIECYCAQKFASKCASSISHSLQQAQAIETLCFAKEQGICPDVGPFCLLLPTFCCLVTETWKIPITSTPDMPAFELATFGRSRRGGSSLHR